MTAIVYHEFATRYPLDACALNFLSAVYYFTKEHSGTFTKTQQHLKNITGCTPYQQRRVREQLTDLNLVTTRRVMKHTEKGHRTQLYYTANVAELDALLAEVEAKREARKSAEGITPDQPKEATQGVLKPVRMHAEWTPDSDLLSGLLNAHNIDTRFVVYEVLPEFRGYWMSQDKACTEPQWQAKLHGAIRRQWHDELARQRRRAKISSAMDAKADAIADLKQRQTQKLQAEANSRRYMTTEEQLLDSSWSKGVFDEPEHSDLRTRPVDSDVPYHQPFTETRESYQAGQDVLNTAFKVVDNNDQDSFMDFVKNEYEIDV